MTIMYKCVVSELIFDYIGIKMEKNKNNMIIKGSLGIIS